MMDGSHAEIVVVPAIMTWPIPDDRDVDAVACVPSRSAPPTTACSSSVT